MNIRRTSFIFRIGLQVLLVFIPFMLTIGWYLAPNPIYLWVSAYNPIPAMYQHHLFHTLTISEKLLCFAIDFIKTGFTLYVIFLLIQVFRCFEKGDLFSLRSIGYLKKTSIAIVFTQIVEPFHQAAMGYALTIHNPPGKRFLVAGFDLYNIEKLLIACVLMLIVSILMEGYKLQQENQLTI